MAWRFDYKFEDGYNSALKLRKLLYSLNKNKFPKSFNGYQNELNKIFEFSFKEENNENENLYVKGFLSGILIPGGINSDILNISSIESFINDQKNYCPVCLLEEGSGILSFATWTGDYEDGDAWCIDLCANEIICIPVSCGDKKRDVVRSNSYGILPNFNYFVSYIAASIIDRKWLKSYKI